MSITIDILGEPERDNALLIKINSGAAYHRLLFDCGENVLAGINNSEIRQIDALFFSHLHLDHAAGFDYFFRRNYDRFEKPLKVYGPDGTAGMLHNKMRGFTWNLVKDLTGKWDIIDINEEDFCGYYVKANEGFSVLYHSGKRVNNGTVTAKEDYIVRTELLDHIIPSAAYSVREPDRINIDKDKLAASGLEPGKWLELLRDPGYKEEFITAGAKEYRTEKLRAELLYESKGEKVTYMTDFGYTEENVNRAVSLARESDILICESQYLEEDIELARKNYHLVARQAAEIAKAAKVKKLVLFHISDRYRRVRDFNRALDEARAVFPETYLPENWTLI